MMSRLMVFSRVSVLAVLGQIGVVLAATLVVVSIVHWSVTGDTPYGTYTKYQQRQIVESFAEAATYGQHETLRALLPDTWVETPQVEVLSSFRMQGRLGSYTIEHVVQEHGVTTAVIHWQPRHGAWPDLCQRVDVDRSGHVNMNEWHTDCAPGSVIAP